MNNQLALSVVILFCIASIFSCAPGEVEVYFPSDFVKDNKVIINGEHNLVDHVGEGTHSFIKIAVGEFSVDVNGKTTKLNTAKGGLLNLNEEEYVIYPIFYTSDFQKENTGLFVPIIVDSVVYLNKNSALLKLPENQQMPLILKEASKPYDSKRIKRQKTGVIGKKDFFAERSWELGIIDEIPDEITVYDKESALKTKLIVAPLFRIQTMLSDDYWSKDLRESAPVSP